MEWWSPLLRNKPQWNDYSALLQRFFRNKVGLISPIQHTKTFFFATWLWIALISRTFRKSFTTWNFISSRWWKKATLVIAFEIDQKKLRPIAPSRGEWMKVKQIEWREKKSDERVQQNISQSTSNTWSISTCPFYCGGLWFRAANNVIDTQTKHISMEIFCNNLWSRFGWLCNELMMNWQGGSFESIV